MAERRTPFRVGPLTIALVVAAAVLIAIGLVYFLTPASSLPGFVPGHAAHSDRHHVKHGLLALGLAFGCLIGAWFSTGERA